MPTLRWYQERAVDLSRAEFAAGRRAVLLQMPTGSGKTPTSIEIMRRARDRGRRVLFLADRRQLVNQAAARMKEWDVPHGIIMAGIEPSPGELIQVASKDTVWSRAFASSRLYLPSPDIVVIDEAHRASNESSLAVWKAHPQALLFGITATPAGPNGKGLGGTYEALVIGATYKELHDDGTLVPNVVYAPTRPDMSKVRHGADGDFIGVQAANVMMDKKIIGDVWEHWERIAKGKKTVVFGQSVEHSIALKDMFRSKGVCAEHVDADTPDDVRDEYYDAFRIGHLSVLCNYGILDTGWDAPWCEVCQIVRATEQRVIWMQMAGRVARPWEGKTEGIVIDHGGNVWRHGYPDQDLPWSLDQDKNIRDIANEHKSKERREADPICCPRCYAYRERGNVCPRCGHVIERRGKACEPVAGTLTETSRSVKVEVADEARLQKEWTKTLAQMAYLGRSCKAARAVFYQRTGQWPDRRFTPMPMDHEWSMKVKDLYPQFIRRKAKK